MAKYLDLNGLSTFWAKIKTHVTSKIAALTNTNTGTPGASKTITAFSQKDGKVSATFESIAINASQITSGTLPISRGGTGGTTATAARTNLDVYSKSETDSLLSGKIEVVEELPATGTNGKIYYVGPTGTGDDKYDEYIWDSTGSKFIKVGEHSLDLSEYVNSVTQTSTGNYVSSITKSGNNLTVTRGTLPAASTTAPKMDGTAAVGTGTTWARADHVHPSDTSRASAADLTEHIEDTTVHITAAERTKWNGKTATNISYANKALSKTVDGTTSEVVKASTIISDTNTFGNFASKSQATAGSTTYETYWEVAPTSTNDVYGFAAHPTTGKLYQIRSNKGVISATALDTNTTYSFDGTYNASSNKAATVSTVTNAIDELDVAAVGGAGKYISAVGQTDGKVVVTALNLSTEPTAGNQAPITSDAVYKAISETQSTMTAITDEEIDEICV